MRQSEWYRSPVKPLTQGEAMNRSTIQTCRRRTGLTSRSTLYAFPLALSLSLSLVAALPAWSDTERAPRNRASFQVEAVREIANDWTTARLSVVAEGKDPAAVANEVNTAMAKAMGKAKRTKGIEVRSGTYATHPIYDDGRIVRWQARQELRLETGDTDRLAKLIGQLQSESTLLSAIDFSVRRETRKALEDELIKEALAAFRERAALIAKNMASKDWSLIDVSVGSTHAAPNRRMMNRRDSAMLSSSKAAPPALEGGTSEIRVHVSGVIELD